MSPRMYIAEVYMCPPLSMMHVAGSRPSVLLLLNSSAHELMTGKTTARAGELDIFVAKISTI